jgi:hypothetical protein
VRESEEVEHFWLPFSTCRALLGRMAAEAEPGFLRVQGEVEQAHPFPHDVQERLRFMLVLEADDRIVRIADHDHVSGSLAASPLVDPQIEYVVAGLAR